MKRLLSYIKDYKVKAVLAPLFKCLEACFDLLVPMVISSMIDTGIKNGDTGYVLKMGGLLLLLAAIGLTCSFTAQFFAAKVAIHTGKGLRNDLFRHINTLSYRDIDALGTSTLITRMTSDINAVESGVNMALRLFMRSPFIVFGAMVMAFTINVKAGIIFAVTIAVLFAVVFGIILTTAPMYRNNQAQLDKIMKTTRENLLGVRVVRAFNRQASEMEQFKRENDRLTEMQVSVGRISALLNPVTYVIINLSVVYLIYRGARFVDIGTLTQGGLVALVNYMSQILVELIKLANLVIQITRAMASMNRIDGVFSIKPSVQEPANVSAGNSVNTNSDSESGIENALSKQDIRNLKDTSMDVTKPNAPSYSGNSTAERISKVSFKNVDFAYTEGADPALSGITFEAMPGETVGVIGGTGAGKSTLINLIPRFYDVTGGEIDIEGRPVKSYGLSELRNKIGIVPQRSVLFRGTLRENMQWGKEDATDEEIYAALRTAQAFDFVEEKGQGLELPVEQEGRNFSGGQKQRLAIARAVVRKPEILILDDSASALDFATDAALRKAIKHDTENMTVFIISQRVSTVRNSDKIIVLDDGKVAGIGTHDELFGSCEVYKEICLSQLNKDEAGTPVGTSKNAPAEDNTSAAAKHKNGNLPGVADRSEVSAAGKETLAEKGKEAE